MISDTEAEINLRDIVFYGVLKTLRDSIRYLYDNPAVNYTGLLAVTRKAEAEVSDGKSGTMTIKAQAVLANNGLISLKQQVSDLVAVVKVNQVQGKSEETTTQQNSSNETNQVNKGPKICGGTGLQTSGARPSKNNQVTCQCYHCWGWVHIAKECAMSLNCSKGGVSIFLSPGVKEIKKSRDLNRTSSNKPHHLKAVKECYHNPDPIACIIGKVNKTHILVDHMECLALVDSAVQLSTITAEFVKQLRLGIHQLDRILRFEVTEEGDIPYIEEIEVNLKIPEIKAINKDSAYAQCAANSTSNTAYLQGSGLTSNKEITQLSTK